MTLDLIWVSVIILAALAVVVAMYMISALKQKSSEPKKK
jgi:hypothetical protein